MAKVRIINNKPGACVINSLKLIIPGNGSVTRDDSVIGDPDIVELESYGIISIVPVVVEPVPSATVKQAANPAPKAKEAAAPQGKSNKKGNKNKGKPIQQVAKAEQVVVAQQPPKRPGTDFRAVDGIEDEMGSKAVVMGDNGPEVKHMNPGLNGQDGPKYVGDVSWKDDGIDQGPDSDGFSTV